MTPVGFFDGAAWEEGSKCGVGAILQIDKSQKFQIKLNSGKGTKTRAEFLALWVLLWVSQLHQVTNL